VDNDHIFVSKAHMRLSNTNLLPILHRFLDIAFDRSKIAIYPSCLFPPPDRITFLFRVTEIPQFIGFALRDFISASSPISWRPSVAHRQTNETVWRTPL